MTAPPRPEQREILTGAFPGRQADTLSRVGYQWRGADQIAALIDTQRGPTAYEHDARGHLVRATLPNQSVELRESDRVSNVYRAANRADRVYGKGGRLLRVGSTELARKATSSRSGSRTERSGSIAGRTAVGSSL